MPLGILESQELSRFADKFVMRLRSIALFPEKKGSNFVCERKQTGFAPNGMDPTLFAGMREARSLAERGLRMERKDQPALRLIVGGKVSGYKSGRKRDREIPVSDSTARTRSAGTCPVAIHPEIVPCDRNPSPRANALCPPAASQASNTASLLMFTINAQSVNSVNARSGNWPGKNSRMGRTSIKPASAFWKRLDDALGQHPSYAPLNPNSLAMKLGMSQGSTSRWYDGIGFPELPTALKLAKDGGVCIDWLLNNVKPKYPISRDPMLRELFDVCESLKEDGRKHVLRAAKGELAQQQGEEHEGDMGRSARLS